MPAMSADDAYDQLFARFLRDHPEHAGCKSQVKLPDGRIESMITIEAAEQFARWSLIHGHGDHQKILDLLTEGLPAARSKFNEMESKPGGAAS